MNSETRPEKQRSHIGIAYPETIGTDKFNQIIEPVKKDGLDIFTHAVANGVMYMSIEWAIPTAFVLWIGKTYFDSFLKEAGKDHYFILKSWLKSTSRFARLIRTNLLSTSSEKMTNEYTQSKSFSIQIQLKSNRGLKVLFDERLSHKDWDEAIDKILDYALENNINYPDDLITQAAESMSLDQDSGLIAIMNPETKTWQLLDHKSMMLYMQNIKK